MRRSLRKHAFNARDFYEGWKFDKFLRINRYTYGDPLTKLCGSVFCYCMALIMRDVIHKNATFKFPQADSWIEMQSMKGDEFVKARLRGDKRTDVDYLASNFTTYYPIYRKAHWRGLDIKRLIFLDTIRQKELADLINSGKLW